MCGESKQKCKIYIHPKGNHPSALSIVIQTGSNTPLPPLPFTYKHKHLQSKVIQGQNAPQGCEPPSLKPSTQTTYSPYATKHEKNHT